MSCADMTPFAPSSAMAIAVWTSCLREERRIWTAVRPFAALRVIAGLEAACQARLRVTTSSEAACQARTATWRSKRHPGRKRRRPFSRLGEHARHKTSGRTGRIAAEGDRAVVFFCVQRGDADEMQPADVIDPEFGRTLRSVMDSGVEAMAWAADISPAGVRLNHALPVSVDG